MASKYQLQRELSQYESLKDQLSRFSSKLDDASIDTEEMHKNLKNHYHIDDDTNKGVERTKKLKTKIDEMSNYVMGTVYPAIDDRMREIREEIERIEQEEREAAERAAARLSSFRW